MANTIADITKRIKTDVQVKLPSTKGLLRNSILMILIEAISGIFYSLNKAIGIVKRDANLLTAEASRLNEFGAIWGIVRKIASKSTASIKVSTTDATVPLGSTFTDDSGHQYTSLAEGIVGSGFTVINVESNALGYIIKPLEVIIPEGSNHIEIEILSFISGQEEEGDPDYRVRILNKIKHSSGGGSSSDYENWLLELPNVTKAFVIPNSNGYGEVLLSYLINGLIPDSGFDDQYIKDAINLKKPVSASVRIGKPVAKIIDVEVILHPDNSHTRAAVYNELSLMFKQHTMRDSIFYKSYLSSAIEKAGVESHNILIPANNVEIGTFELPQLGEITFK